MEIDILQTELDEDAKRKPYAVKIEPTRNGADMYVATRFAEYLDALNYVRTKISWATGKRPCRVSIDTRTGPIILWDQTWGEEWTPDKIKFEDP